MVHSRLVSITACVGSRLHVEGVAQQLRAVADDLEASRSRWRGRVAGLQPAAIAFRESAATAFLEQAA
eukprot:6388091-Alexandrium_andersonii.AAC.1